ncbi:SET domain protein [Hygrophoropsis aurantiaca]|uniref:SET domain protein n=1 Tax=Hygrophoropsis aurantiaca TaxID=72124 RepID=A0ACB8AQA6_9AGAM|nr:SET domain protein [Hygrophoropsis aurantiaca]
MAPSKPSSWPSNVQYIGAPRFHTTVSPAMRAFLTNGTNNTRKVPVSSHAGSCLVRIRYISDPSHPARGQYGLFAAKKIPSQTHIIDYLGEVHCDQRNDSDYDLSLYRSQDGLNVGVDASVMGNESRFVNDYRGIRGKPNAVFVDSRTPLGELRMSVWSTGETIKKGDEILVSYGKSWWRARTAENGDKVDQG